MLLVSRNHLLRCSVVLLGLFATLIPGAFPAVASSVPSAANSGAVPPDNLGGLVVCPPYGGTTNPVSIILVTVRNAANAVVPGAEVELQLSARHPVCSDAVLSGTTGANGEVTLELRAGSCSNDIPLSGILKANGVTIRSFSNVKSPDIDGDLDVDIVDLLEFSRQFLGTAPPGCADFDNDGEVGLGELIVFGPPFTGGAICTP